MGTPAPSLNGPPPSPTRTRLLVLRWLTRSLPTAVVLAGLAMTAYWGHATGWEFTNAKPGSGQPTTAPSDTTSSIVAVVSAAPGTATAHLLSGKSVRIEFASAEAVDAAGIDITPVWQTTLTEQVTAGGEITFDPNRLARLGARAGGVTRRVFKAPGDPVRAGELLALIDSAEVGRRKAEFQQALVQARLREKTRDDLVGAKTVASPAAVREAEAALKEADVRVLAAAQLLTNLGLPVRPADYRGLSPVEAGKRLRLLGLEEVTADLSGTTGNMLPVRSPFSGVLLLADAVAGEVVETGKTLFVVVDPSRVWITLHLSTEAARRAKVGQKVLFREDGGRGEHPATVVFVGTAADETTRTVPVRAEAENTTGALRASSLGRGRLVFREEPSALVVPHEAVYSFRGQTLVFVRDPDFLKRDGPKAFHVRVVKTGGRDERNTEILAGLSAGEIVAAKGSGFLLGELTRAVEDR